ncbi:zinc finger BED domain-containing protein RICESLEEPER 2-like isoform X1 [Dioscorea cayenensis subsp. rotundata]|uniref:Zinc finger BED domain-containing protein RICESLEEPER 2-like isoform X1 n=2 Tax=Dioscorea cayennensis subsp. rotundata TaxID=55577 RepID=A0AB40BD80_DIOCR|nr:zinc finger BED domain-containing protein RICESLEEPER 2-like isoform X1 [Dioscorea cayenensis subsp. rotundata]XP_039125274.1 zinc finger BED domain-containing protein RICESLEEPER 2-like isoform X1 [Dioscorea cayenensis subsp. rotundata]XP_039125275.1 zinc finger BED domain-containing protein RICESLEEPER 2-like isoform X1 [Dioscorea cayenensis subsp. rotundata]XP_039125276.1 zinc finger BED domain-containing protein RICESLEEPER 2-like isoform X1 [Dioscorea cayenensis subsp. rotundata]
MLALNEVVEQLMEEGVSEDVDPVASKRPRKSRSRVWNDFKKVYVGNKVKAAICNHCKSQLTAGSNGGTSHLARHLRKCPRRILLNEKPPSLPCARPAAGKASSLKDWTFDQEISRSKLARMVVLHEYPFSIVEHEGLNDFLSSLNPMFKMITPSVVKEDCLAMFEKEKKSMREKFISSCQRVALTSNMWSSKQGLEYLSLTAHFIDDEWKLQKRVLMFSMVESPRNAMAVANVILKGVREWNLDGRISNITLDDGPMNDALVTDLKENLLLRNSLLLNGKLFHVRCAAHVLNFIVQDGLKEIHAVIYNVRESIKYLKSCPSRKQKFQELVREVGISYARGLCLDVASRWNSTYYMLERAVQFKKAFTSLALIDSGYKFAPSIDDWRRAEIVCKLLRTFYNAIKVVTGFHSPTSNLSFHEMWKVRTILHQEVSNEDHFIGTMARDMQKRFDKYWKVSYLHLAIPVILDPQFKMKYVEYRFTQAFGNEAHKYVGEVYNAMLALFGEYHMRSNSQLITREMHTSIAREAVGTSRDIDSLLDWDQHISQQNSIPRDVVGTSRDDIDALSDWDQHVSQQTNYQIVTELDRYLEDGIFPRKNDFDILNWWMVSETKYPTLARIARDVLATPAATVASELVFSSGGRFLNDFRSSLSCETAEALICTQDWLRAGKTTGMGTINDLEDDLSNLEL